MLRKTIFLLVTAGILVFIFRNPLAKFGFEKGFNSFFNQQVVIEDVKVSLNLCEFELINFYIIDPAISDDSFIAKAPRVMMNLNIFKYLLTGKFYLNQMLLDIEELNLIRNSDGMLNVSRFERNSSNINQPKTNSHFFLNELNLSIKQVTFLDLTKTEKNFRTIKLNVQGFVFKDVGNLTELVRVVLSQAIYSKKLTYVNDELDENFHPIDEKLWNAQTIQPITIEPTSAEKFDSGLSEKIKNFSTQMWETTKEATQNTINSLKSSPISTEGENTQ